MTFVSNSCSNPNCMSKDDLINGLHEKLKASVEFNSRLQRENTELGNQLTVVRESFLEYQKNMVITEAQVWLSIQSGYNGNYRLPSSIAEWTDEMCEQYWSRFR